MIEELTRAVLQFAIAMVATICFGVAFQAPRRHFVSCGLVGAVGWVVYLLATSLGGLSAPVATLIAAIPLTAIARWFAIAHKAPITLFLLCGIFPLVPGLGIYQTAYAMVNNATAEAGQIGFTTLKTAIAMVLAILLGLELPGSWFRRLASHWSK